MGKGERKVGGLSKKKYFGTFPLFVLTIYIYDSKRGGFLYLGYLSIMYNHTWTCPVLMTFAQGKLSVYV